MRKSKQCRNGCHSPAILAFSYHTDFPVFFPSQLSELFQTDALVTFDIPYRCFLVIKNPKAVLSKKSEILFSAKAHFLIFSKGIEYNCKSIPDTAKGSHCD